MIFVEPEKGVTDQKITDLVSPVVKNEGAPILVFALTRIHVLIQIGAVEFREPVCVLRKMSRHPIDDDADPSLMTLIDEMPQFVRCSEPARRRIIIGYLITPRAFKRMLSDRKQLDMGVTHFQHIRQQCLGELEVT